VLQEKPTWPLPPLLLLLQSRSAVLTEPYIRVSHEIGCVINGLLRELVWKLQVRLCCPLLFGENWKEEEEEVVEK
jgi:hypothetical protein